MNRETSNTIASVMTPTPILIGPQDPLALAESRMKEIHVRHWPVSQEGWLVGMLSLRDLLQQNRPTVDGESVGNPEAVRTVNVMRAARIVTHPDEPVARAAELMNRHRLSCLPVLEKDELIGIVTLDLVVEYAIQRLREEEAEIGFAPIVARLMTHSPLATVQVLERVDVAEIIMRQYNCRHLPVMRGDRVVGILSDRDILEVLRTSLDPASAILVGEIMTSSPQTTHPDLEAVTAGSALVHKRIGALPVVRQGRLVGILSKSDFLLYVVAMDRSRPSRGTFSTRINA